MTDETNSHDPDGFVVIHHPADGSEWYGIGPFPPIDDLWDMLVKESACTCRIERLWVRFPKGIILAVEPPPEIAGVIRDIARDLIDRLREGPAPDSDESNDRLN